MIRRILHTLVFTITLGACAADADTAGEPPADSQPEASVTPEARPVQGMRAIDRARDASELASERALRHDTIR